MGKLTTLGCYELDLQRFNTVAFSMQKSQIDLMHILATELESLLKDAIAHEVKNGKVTLFFNLSTKRTGNKLEIMFVPKLKVVSEKVPMNSPEPTTQQIESRCFGAKPHKQKIKVTKK